MKWFEPFGKVYKPVSWQGAFVCFLLIMFSTICFAVVDNQSHSASDTLLGVAPFFVLALYLYFWIAKKTC